jgi:hypothetical protein
MFNGPDLPKSLDEGVFNRWLEDGRLKRIGYRYLLIIWDSYEAQYKPVYAERREEIGEYENYSSSTSRESLTAVYDLFSESRIG